jgi:O-Antigen ligase
MTARALTPVARADFLSVQPRRADGATLCCLFAVVLLVIPSRMVLRGIPFALTPASVIAMLVGFVWFCAQFTRTLGASKGPNAVRTGLFIFGAAIFITYGVSTFGYLPADELGLADHAFVLMVAILGLALGACDGISSAHRVDLVVKAIVVCGAISGTVGICQFLLKFDPTSFKLPMLRYESTETLGTIERGGLLRVGGTMGHPIEFGVVSSMILPFAAHLAFQARERRQPALRWWVCTALIAIGMMFSASRSAMVGLGAVTLVLFIGWPRRRKAYALLTGAIFLVAMKIAVPGLIGNIINLFANAGKDDSVKYRTHDYPVATAEIGRHLWFGRGYGTWYAPKHMVFDNQYLLTAVEGGVLGVVAFVLIFLVGIMAAVRFRYLATDPSRRDLGLTIAAALVVPLLGSATFDLASFKTAEGLSFLLIGLAGALLRITKAERPGPPMIPRRRPAGSARAPAAAT